MNLRTILALCAVLAFGSAAKADNATVVHSAGWNLVANSGNRPVWTNEFGGVWYYQRSENVLASDEHPRFLLTGRRQYKDYNGVGGPSVPSPASPKIGYIVVNRNNATFTKDQMGCAYGLEPARLFTHPGDTADNKATVLGFRVPRTATYTVRVTGQCMQYTSDGAYDMKIALLLNNAVLNGNERTLYHKSEAATPAADRTFDITVTQEFRRGDLLEFVVHMGQDLNSDGVKYDFDVTETLPAGSFIVNSADANEAVRAGVQIMGGECAPVNLPGLVITIR